MKDGDDKLKYVDNYIRQIALYAVNSLLVTPTRIQVTYSVSRKYL